MLTDQREGTLFRRRWPRERVWLTVLARSNGRERFGRAVDMSPGGLCVVFPGPGCQEHQAVEVDLVAGRSVRRLQGLVCFSSPRGRHTRVGIRTFGFLPGQEPLADDRPCGIHGAPPSTPHDCSHPKGGVSVNLGLDFDLVSAGARRAMDRDRAELGRAIRARYATAESEDWDRVLRRFLDDLATSPLRSRFLREQFRAAMHTRYPAARGSVIRGRVIPTGAGLAAGDLPPCGIHLDHFAVASSDRWGNFVVQGIPSIDDAVSLPLRIANYSVLSTQPVAVNLPPVEPAQFDVDLPIRLRDTRPRRAPSEPAPRLVVVHGGAEDQGSAVVLDPLWRMIDAL